jgi:hypothetical protein
MNPIRHRGAWPTAPVLLIALVLIGGCGGKSASFHYPSESLVYPPLGPETPALFVELVNDLRPGSQRGGEGGVVTYRFPSDENWDRPVNQIYYQALVQDLTETDLVQLVPLRSQADYSLEVDLNHMGCKVSRSAAGFLLTAVAGGAAGWALSGDAAGAALGAVVGVGAIPVPTKLRAVCEVTLRVYDAERRLFFERTCLGEITKSRWDGITSRKDQQWVDEYLTVAVKRCNACLLGQLRQARVEAGAGATPDVPADAGG